MGAQTIPQLTMANRTRSVWVRAAIYVWSVVVTALCTIGQWLYPRLGSTLAKRRLTAGQLQGLAVARSRATRCFLYFCSSAGEYEQALPCIAELGQTPDTYVQLVFFSESGFNFARARNEQRPILLAPADTLWSWRALFQALRPDAVFVVRHELWPAFLAVAHGSCPTILLNGSRHSGATNSLVSTWVKRILLRFFDAIYTVSFADKEYFANVLHVSPEIIWAVGDTKYDRAYQRVVENAEIIRQLRSKIVRSQKTRVIIGSAWEADVRLLLASLQDQKLRAQCQLICAPHKTDPAMVQWIENECKNAGLTVSRYSEMQTHNDWDRNWDVLVVDCVGLLCELYACADLAFIGGALHHQVHNVLEPISHGLPVAYGPRYENSQEAVRLVGVGLARIMRSESECTAWIRSWLSSPEAKNQARGVHEYFSKHLGAARHIRESLTHALPTQ